MESGIANRRRGAVIGDCFFPATDHLQLYPGTDAFVLVTRCGVDTTQSRSLTVALDLEGAKRLAEVLIPFLRNHPDIVPALEG